MRKMTLLLSLSVVAVGLGVTPALAQDAPKPPHRALLSDWEGVEVAQQGSALLPCGHDGTDCSFSAEVPSVTHTKIPIVGWVRCDDPASIEGSLGPNGAVTVTDFDTCHAIYSNVSYSGEICGHSRTGELWLRQAIGARHAFVRIVAEPTGYNLPVPTYWVNGLRFGDAETWTFAGVYDFAQTGLQMYLQANFDDLLDGSNILAGRDQGGDECGWPELS
jgi:hypothetical protein